jgi:hypothetical protein
VLVIAAAAQVLFSQISFADGMSEKKQALISTYLKRAFSYGENKQLRKFDLQNEISIAFTCEADKISDCNASYLLSSEAVRETQHLKFAKSSRSDLRIIFADGSRAKAIIPELAQQYSSGIADQNDSDCQVLRTEKDYVIEGAVIVVSVDQNQLRQKICLTSQLTKALGLSHPASLSFTELWNQEPSGYKSFNETDFTELLKSNVILSSIQMCKELRAGMSLKEVIGVLAAEQSVCFNEIEGL